MISTFFAAVVILTIPSAAPAPASKGTAGPPPPASSALAPQPTAPTGGSPVRRATPSTVEAVLMAARPGEVVQLASGHYPLIEAAPAKAEPGVIVEPAPGAEVTIRAMKLKGCSGLTFRRLTFTRWTGIDQCERITFEQSLFQGDQSKFARPEDHGIQVLSSRRVTIRDNRFRYLAWAVQHSNNTELTIENNDVQYIRFDGVRGGMGSTRVVVRNNRFSNFYAAAEAHRDGIQFWPGPKGARDILVEGNVLQPGETEGRFQHIFIGPDGGGGYDNLVVRRNVSLGAANHGIMIAGARSGEVSENFVQAMPGYGAFIGISRVEGQPRNWGNVSPGKLTSDDPKRPNSVVKPAKGLTDRSAYEAWAAARAGGSGS